MNEHPDAFADAMASLNAVLPDGAHLDIDALWGEGPHFATVTWGDRVVTARGETPGAAIRDLAARLARLGKDGAE